VTSLTEAALAASSAMLLDLGEIAELTQRMAGEKKPIAVDVETGYYGESTEGLSLRAEANIVVSVQFTNSLDWGRMVPLAFDCGPNVDAKAFAALLWPMLNARDDEGLPLVVGHGVIAELRWLCRFLLRQLWDHPVFGAAVIAARGRFPIRSCTLLESFSEGENPKHGLKDITKRNSGYEMRNIFSLWAGKLTKKQQDSIRFNELDPSDPEVTAYACEDVVWCLWHHLRRFDVLRTGPRKFIYKTEMAVLPVVADMADEGVCVDWNRMREVAREGRAFAGLLLAEVIEDFSALAGEPVSINFNSSQQKADLFYNKCGMKATHFSKKTGRPSTDAKRALPELGKKHPEMAKYLKWAKLDKLVTGFLDLWEGKYAWAPDGRGHPQLLQHGTIGGRFSCEAFNYQQSPKKYHLELRDGTTFDFNFRELYTAPPPGTRPWWSLVLEEAGAPPGLYIPEEHEEEPGWYLMGFDYSQIELRVLAAEAGETALLEAFRRGDDVHALTAALMLGKDLASVTKDERDDTGKRMNFAIGYQLSPKGLADQLGIPQAAAEALFAQYHAAYPRLKPFTAGAVREARRSSMGDPDRAGTVITKWGRKIRIWEYASPSRAKRAAGDRTAGNVVIQGPATGEYVKIAMVRAIKALEKAGLASKVRLVMNIHDALEFYVRKDVKPATVIEVLSPAVVYEIPNSGWPPMVAEWHLGTSWGAAREIVYENGDVRLASKAPRPEPPVEPDDDLSPADDDVQAGPELAGPVAGDDPVCADVGPADPEPAPAAWEPGSGRTVLIHAAGLPSASRARQLVALLRSLPGPNQVVVCTAEGDAPVRGTSGLTPEHEGEVATILGGAVVAYALDSVDTEALAAGLQ
jgi:DNA polymerase I-like protein with 3'-5' exonuclease and polymerase domains